MTDMRLYFSLHSLVLMWLPHNHDFVDVSLHKKERKEEKKATMETLHQQEKKYDLFSTIKIQI